MFAAASPLADAVPARAIADIFKKSLRVDSLDMGPRRKAICTIPDQAGAAKQVLFESMFSPRTHS